MNIQCPKCHTKYKIDIQSIAQEGTKMECTKCKTVFVTRKKPVSKIENIISNIKTNISEWENRTKGLEAKEEESKREKKEDKTQEEEIEELEDLESFPEVLITQEETAVILDGFKEDAQDLEEKEPKQDDFIEEENLKVQSPQEIEEIEPVKEEPTEEEVPSADAGKEETPPERVEPESKTEEESAEKEEVSQAPDEGLKDQAPEETEPESEPEEVPPSKEEGVEEQQEEEVKFSEEKKLEDSPPEESPGPQDENFSAKAQDMIDDLVNLEEGKEEGEKNQEDEKKEEDNSENGEKASKENEIMDDLLNADSIQFDDATLKAAVEEDDPEPEASQEEKKEEEKPSEESEEQASTPEGEGLEDTDVQEKPEEEAPEDKNEEEIAPDDTVIENADPQETGNQTEEGEGVEELKEGEAAYDEEPDEGEEIEEEEEEKPKKSSRIKNFILKITSIYYLKSKEKVKILGKIGVPPKVFALFLWLFYLSTIGSIIGVRWLIKPQMPDVAPKENLQLADVFENTPDEKNQSSSNLDRVVQGKDFLAEEDESQSDNTPPVSETQENPTVPEDMLKVGIIIPIAYNSDETKIMNILINFHFDTQTVVEEINNSATYYEDIIEHIISSFLKDIFYEDIPSVQEKLKKEIKSKMNTSLKKGKITAIDFEEFSLQ